MEHTKEPWVIKSKMIQDDDYLFVSSSNESENIVVFGVNSLDTSNARRIVACVNACAGLKTELLETEGYSIKEELDGLAGMLNTQAELDSLDEQINKRLEAEKHIEELNKYIEKLEETPIVIDFKMKPVRLEVDIEEFKSMYLTKLSPISKDVYDSIATAFKSYIEAKNNIKD